MRKSPLSPPPPGGLPLERSGAPLAISSSLYPNPVSHQFCRAGIFTIFCDGITGTKKGGNINVQMSSSPATPFVLYAEVKGLHCIEKRIGKEISGDLWMRGFQGSIEAGPQRCQCRQSRRGGRSTEGGPVHRSARKLRRLPPNGNKAIAGFLGHWVAGFVGFCGP